MSEKGFVYLVGAGPGRADLITVRGAELLKAADCIIYDKLANPALLKFAREDAELIHVPKRIGSRSVTQQQINKLLIDKASEGKTVVRLKGGDPCIFGRGSEEVRVLAAAGVDFEIVPGVTAAIAAAEYSGIMLTDRQYSSQVIFVTAREAEGKQKGNIDWHLLAEFTGTVVFYMGLGNLDFVVQTLMENGKPEQTPVAVISNATFPSQSLVKAPLNRISEKCRQQGVEPPAMVIMGAAADSDPQLNWFMRKPLFGRNIVVTRDVRGNADFAAKIIQRGGNPIEFATIKLKPLTRTNRFLQALAKIAEFDWVIFTSTNGVTLFLDSLRSLGKDARGFASAKIAAIGSETEAKLGEFGIQADFVPAVFTSRELGRQLIRFTNLQRKKILLLRSQLASDELVELLTRAGAEVQNVPVYSIVQEKNDGQWLLEKIEGNQIHWLMFASPSSARMFFEQIPVKIVNASHTKLASIGPVTSEELKNLGVSVEVEATEHTIDGLLAAIEKSEKSKN